IKKANDTDVAVLNGDTIFKADLSALFHFHTDKKSAVSIALKEMKDFDRYGSVNIDEQNCIRSFEEKKHMVSGLINGRIYIINRPSFLAKHHPDKFSFEKDHLERYVNEGLFYGLVSDAYFLDIGIPEDYAKAQT